MARQIIGLACWLLLCFLASGIGAIASVQADLFYHQLTQPNWAPPSWVFGPVWTGLYTLMAISAWLIWRIDGFNSNRTALTFFLVQLALNTVWSWLFFAWHFGGLAFLDIILLWILILVTLILFWRIRTLAGILLVPYLLWVSFAAFLNYSLWQLNPHILS